MIFLAHAAPPVQLGLNEWLFVIAASAIILAIMGPSVVRKLRQSDD